MTDVIQPFAAAAPYYLKRGWAPFPLPECQKKHPPDGFTGAAGVDADIDQIRAWIAENGRRNIGVRMPADVVGFDVDDYDEKTGGAELGELEAKLGSLPPSPISTSRDDQVSGIRFFRVPPGLKWPGNLSRSSEVIKRTHRYAVVEPSLHPDTGRQYRWLNPDWSELGDVPSVDQLPELPRTWVEHFTGGESDTGPEAKKDNITPGDVTSVLTPGPMCRAVEKAYDEYTARKASKARHDAMITTVQALVRHGEQGHAGAAEAVKRLRAQFSDDVHDRDPDEFERALNGAVAIVLARPTAAADRGCCGPEVPPVTSSRTHPNSRTSGRPRCYATFETSRELGGLAHGRCSVVCWCAWSPRRRPKPYCHRPPVVQFR